MIKSADISVIVPGSIIGKRDSGKCAQLTRRALKSIRKHLPDAEIILSTWEEQDVGNLEYDTLVLTPDPGPNYYITPQGRVPYHNYNRQITAVQAGLRRATRKYALKTRNDILFSGNRFLDFYDKFPHRCNDWKILRKRVIVGSILTYHPRRAKKEMWFNVCDFFHFGLKEDVEMIWSVQPVQDMRMPFSIEQTLWLTMLSRLKGSIASCYDDFGSDHRVIYEMSLANNAIVLSHQQIGIRFLKYGYGITSQLYYCSYNDWLSLYSAYCDPDFCAYSSVSVKMKDNFATQKIGQSLLRIASRIDSPLAKRKNEFLNKLLCIFE